MANPMSTEIQRLRTLISKVQFKPDHLNTSVRSDIRKIIDEELPSYETECPPLDIISYAIKDILFPKLLLDQIPDLLDMLTITESYRKQASKQAREALDRNEKHKQNKNKKNDLDFVCLTADEEKKITRLVQSESNANHREIYRMLIFDFCKHGIYELWTSPISHLLPARMNDYFPSLSLPNSKPSTLLFHSDFTNREKAELHETAVDCLKFLRDANAWETRREAHLKATGHHKLGQEESEFESYKRDFTSAFKSNVDLDSLTKALDYFMNKVQTYVQTLERIFPSNILS